MINLAEGKTVLASRVVEEAKKLETASTVLFFYFKQEDSDRNNFLSMARTLLMQMLEQNPHTLDYFYSKCCNSVGTFLASRAIVEELLAVALRNCESAYIVLDGLDECSSRKERGEIVKWFREMIDSLPLDERDRLRCLFVSQNDSARKDYRDFSSITVDADNNENDIEAFSKVQSERLMAKLGISEHKANELAANVTASAEGKSDSRTKKTVRLMCGFTRHISFCPSSVDQFVRPKLYPRLGSGDGVIPNRP
jgi:hypothetical protein